MIVQMASRRKNQRISPSVLQEIQQMGLQVFGKREAFQLWLQTPSIALGRQRPVDLLADAEGREIVLRELCCIEHGIFC
jgi:putative toxin-antitoxin system antitoxin component (TIGR02293 family)